MNFTPEQQKAISLRDRNILVSAAAGSGKTAVLVARIIGRIMDKKQPVDIDRLLVMTFTKAAADQMRERIFDAIEEKRKENPFDAHLQKQSALVHHAKITTIHGFCLDILRNHFHEIGLDPDFRVGDEGECRLMKQDVLEKVLEAAYETGEPEFLTMTESLAVKKSDRALETMILKLHEFSMSYPKQEEWLAHCKDMYAAASEDRFEALFWVKGLLADIKQQLNEILERLRQLLMQTEAPEGPYMYRSAIAQDVSSVEQLCMTDRFCSMQRQFSTLAFMTLGRERKDGAFVDPEKKEAVRNGRNQCKKLLQKIAGDFFQDTPKEAVLLLQESSGNVSALADITLAFSRAYAEAKRNKNIVDFNDLEHLSLMVLENGKDTTAREYREFFEEIYVDEYQDSNLVQETLLGLISRPERPNVFMVGDVKQSIYRFRLARPSLFMEKYDTYTEKDSIHQRIDLHYNFRSRREVLDAVNEIFQSIMKKELGNIAYDDAAKLHYGAEYPKDTGDGGPDRSAELLLLTADESISERELEAKAIAGRIRELVRTQTIWDKKEKCYRAVRYSDIVILLRTNKGWDEIFKTVIAGEGIPIHATSSTGYFSAPEVRTTLEFLRVVDNPIQDIPLAAVMRSTFGNFTDEELAVIRSMHRDGSLYDAVLAYQKDGKEEKLKQKAEQFLDLLGIYRERSAYMSVYELLLAIMEGDYGSCILAMPQGERRRANLNMLLKKAEDYGKTSYKGLFHFVRYIEFLQKYEVDFGEANLLDENDNTVRLMSIHKSKGLEFPICFVAGMSKKINYQDARAGVVLDVDYGIGMDRIDIRQRTKRPTLLKKAAALKLMRESLAEEMRVLYVALTRAEEKLIMTGVVKDVQKTLTEESFLAQAGSFLDFFVYARQNTKTDSCIRIMRNDAAGLTAGEVKEELSREAVRGELYESLQHKEQGACTEFGNTVRKRLAFVYPYEADPNLAAKVSVSELKKRSMLLQEAADADIPLNEKFLYEDPVIVPYIPKFARTKDTYEAEGALYGTAFHRLLELWDYKNGTDADSICTYYEGVLEKKRMESELYEAVQMKDLLAFFGTELAARMGRAAQNGMLYREQPFVIGIGKTLIEPIAAHGEEILHNGLTVPKQEELLLVQGIIDAYFVENGELVVVDYKTDKLGSPAALLKRYHAQLNYYAYALEKMTGLSVKEKTIYSSFQNREIRI